MKIAISLLICLTVLTNLCLGDEQEETGPLFRVKQNDQYGYIDKTGKIVIKPQFRYAGSFHEGLALAEPRYGYRGYIDKTGKFVINKGDEDFSEGLALVDVYIDEEKAKFGFIDKTGNFVIEPKFDKPRGKWFQHHYFSEGLAAIYDKETDSWGYIDKTGKMVIEPQFSDTGYYCGGYYKDFSEGLCAVRIKGKKGKYGYIDKTGQFVIESQFSDAYPFSEGLAAVRINGKYGYIDKTGQFVIEPQFDEIGNPSYSDGFGGFSEGLASVSIGGKLIIVDFAVNNYPIYDLVGDKYGYIDKTGQFVIEPQFRYARNFSDGLGLVSFDDDKSGYVDKTGKIVFKLPADSTGSDFHNGLAKVEFGYWKKGKWGYIDKTGRLVWKSDALRKEEWLKRGGLVLLAILLLLAGLFIRKYRRSKSKRTKELMRKKVLIIVCILTATTIFLCCLFPYTIYFLITKIENPEFKGLCLDYRLEAMALFIGLGLIGSGIWAVAARKVDPNADRLSPVEEQKIKELNKWYYWRMPATFILKGKKAIYWGLAFVIVGIAAVWYSSTFWLKMFVPVVQQALEHISRFYS